MDENPEVKTWKGLKGKEEVFNNEFLGGDPSYVQKDKELIEANKDCKDDAKAGGDPEQYKCEYDITIINKLFSKKFADSGSPAYDVLKKMKLTNDDQELVAKAIAGDKQDPEEAGAEWVADNEAKVQEWLE